MQTTGGPRSPQTASRPTALILFGPPGSGKGTQAGLLEKCLRTPRISTGDMLREHIQAGDELGRNVRNVMGDGRLVADDLVNHLVDARIRQDDAVNGFILDGYPRTLQQAGILDRMLSSRGVSPVVVHLKVDYNDIVTRLAGGRRQCPKCGALYNLSTNPPKVDLICDLDGTGLVARPDDSDGAIRRRLEDYESQTRPLLDFFRSSGYPYHEVNGGAGSPPAIAKQICNLVAGKP